MDLWWNVAVDQQAPRLHLAAVSYPHLSASYAPQHTGTCRVTHFSLSSLSLSLAFSLWGGAGDAAGAPDRPDAACHRRPLPL
jgi:hypothetical protein